MTVNLVGSDQLSVAMREGSAAEHREAESSEFVERLVAGELAVEGYVQYLVRLRTVYAALESAGAMLQTDPIAGRFHDADLDRVAAINADLAFWAPEGAPSVVSPAADAYAARVLASTQWGGLYIAHHYTRYLGDLSGGQAIGKVLSRTFELDGRGVDFYEFTEIPKPKPYKDAYRLRLDSLGLDETDRDRVVGEVKIAFQLNHAVFEELAGHLGQWQLVR
jgi:heme oxygenase